MVQPDLPVMRLDGQVALVTGAGRGLGKSIAVALAAYGADVALVSRSPSELEETAEAVSQLGRRAVVVPGDVLDGSFREAMVETTVKELGRLDILVNNAGRNIPRPALEVTEADWEAVQDLNVKSLFFCSQVAARAMRGTGGGRIINISSQAGLVALPKRAAYGASKGAVHQLTRNLAVEWAPDNITVNSVAPTFVLTPMTRPMLEDPDFRAYVMRSIPLGRLASPGDVAGAVLFLASPAAAMITGVVLPVDGGWTAW